MKYSLKTLLGTSALSALLLAGCATKPFRVTPVSAPQPQSPAQATQTIYPNPLILKPTISTNSQTYSSATQSRNPLELILDNRTNVLKSDHFEREGVTYHVFPNTNSNSSGTNEFPYVLWRDDKTNFRIDGDKAVLSVSTPVYIGKRIPGLKSLVYGNSGPLGLGVTKKTKSLSVANGQFGVGDETEITQERPLMIFNFGGLSYTFPADALARSGPTNLYPVSETGFWAQEDRQRGYESMGSGNNNLYLKIVGPVYTFKEEKLGDYLDRAKPAATNAQPSSTTGNVIDVR